MSKDFKKYAEELQKKIMEQDIIDHNENIVNLFYNPKNWGKPPDKEITISEERRGGLKNYFLGFYIKMVNDKIIKANFVTDGCGVMVAVGSQTTILIENKSITYAENLGFEEINKALLGLPEEEKHCVHYAVDTLKALIKKYKELKNK